jgi:hypothetical protein
MFRTLTHDAFNFKYDGKDFEIYNSALIEELLGVNNQNPVNIASSTWKRIIKRNRTEKQDESISQNPKFIELEKIIKDHIKIDSKLLEKSKKDIVSLLSLNLKNFKNNGLFRKKCLALIIEKGTLKTDIPMEYFYIVFCLYVALKFNYFKVDEKEKFFQINFNNEEDFNSKFIDILENPYISINNITCFCYRQYFWLDYRLTESLNSEIHTIIYQIFSDLGMGREEENQISIREEKEYAQDSSSFRAEERSVAEILGRVGKEYIVPE